MFGMPQQADRSSLTATLLVCASALYLYVNLFASLRVPFLIGGDQVYFWGRAMRLLEGERLYRDFLQFTQPPGLDLLFLSTFKVFGLRMWVTNVVVLVLGVAFVWVMFSIARRFMRRESAVLAVAVFLVPVYGKALNATHHWFAVLAVLAAIRSCWAELAAWRVAARGSDSWRGVVFQPYHGLAGLLAFSVFLLWNGTRTRSRRAGLLRRTGAVVRGVCCCAGMLYTHYLVSGGKVERALVLPGDVCSAVHCGSVSRGTTVLSASLHTAQSARRSLTISSSTCCWGGDGWELVCLLEETDQYESIARRPSW